MKLGHKKKKVNFWRYVKTLVIVITKKLCPKIVSKGKDFQPFPNEAPH